jgi:hypothetical protein
MGLSIRAFISISDGKDVWLIENVQDVEDILDWNSEARRDEQHSSDWGRHVARIPNVIYVRWFNEEHAKGNTTLTMFSPEFDAIVQKKLNDPEWAYLRCDRPSLVAGWSK